MKDSHRVPVKEMTLTRADIDDEMLKRMRSVLSTTWGTIGADMEEGRVAVYGANPPAMTAEELAEVILDADYISMYGHDDEAIVMIRKLTFEEGDAFAREWASQYV